MAPVRWNDHLSPLAQTHAKQTFLQAEDHLVCSESREGRCVVVPVNGHMTYYHQTVCVGGFIPYSNTLEHAIVMDT